MAFQGQTITFQISSSGSYNGGTQAAIFLGNSIVNNKAWVAIQSINVSYNDGTTDHHRAISQFIPKVSGVSGTQVTVDLQFEYADNHPNYMSGNVQVLVMADVN